MQSKKRKKIYRKRNRKIRIILLNILILLMFVVIAIQLLQLFIPVIKERFVELNTEAQFEIVMSDEEISALPTTKIDEVNTYGEVINLSLEGQDTYNIHLYDTSTNTTSTGFVMEEYNDIGINGNDMPIGSYFLQLDDESFLSYDEDLSLDFRTITRNGVNNLITVETVDGILRITKSEPEENDDEVDIFIDAGHGGNDSGASSADGTVLEKDLNLELATIIAEDLSDLGYNVEMSRTDDTNPGTCEDNISSYCSDGRVTRSYDSGAKLVISVHHNTGGSSGFEVYTSYYATTAFSSLVAENLKAVSDVSRKITGYISDGVYQETYVSEYDNSTIQDYMYMIRETGGTATNSLVEENVANNTKLQGAQAVLVEFGYLDDYDDLEHVTDPDVMEQEADAVVTAVDQYLTETESQLIDTTTSEASE